MTCCVLPTKFPVCQSMVELAVHGAAFVDVMWPLLRLLMRWCCEQQNVSDARACKTASGGSGDSQIC